ncbi:MAG: Cell wall surface anchor family protein, partial [Parcubacteria group bacterium Gr01-1014_46]
TQLSVSSLGFGTTTLSGLNVSGSATSTSNVGFNITTGCYAIGNTCVGGGSFSNTLASGGTATTTFLNGGVVFSDGYRLTQASSTSSFYWDDTNRRLGLGTSTPFAKLSINSSGGESPFVIGSSTQTYFEINKYGALNLNVSSTSAFNVVDGSGNDIFTIDTTGASTNSGIDITAGASQTGNLFNIFKSDGTTNLLTVTYAGYLGIGTSTPQGILTIASTTAPQLTLSAGGGLAQWAFRNAGGNFYLATTTVAGTATSSMSALSIDKTSGTTTVWALNVNATGSNATSTIEGNLNVKGTLKIGTASVFMSELGVHTTGQTDFNFSSDNNSTNFGFGTSTPKFALTVASTTAPQIAISGGAGLAQWTFRNAGGNFYLATTTVAGTATTSISAIEIAGSGFGTTTLRGLNIMGLATSTSNVGFNITTGCFAVNNTCVGGGASADPSIGGTLTSATLGSVLFASNATFAQDNANFFFDDTNNRLGLGTTTPWAQLSVNANGIGANPQFSVGSSTKTDFIVDNRGFVGLGTTTPWAMLSVNANGSLGSAPAFAIGSSTRTLFSVDNAGNTTVGDSAGTGDATFQFASDTNAWSVGYNSSDKSFRIASSTNLSSNVMFEVDKTGTVFLNAGLGTGTGGNYLCIDTSTYQILRGNGASCTASSARFKDNIFDINYGLADVMNLRAVSFVYKPEMNSGTSTHLGFIAEEVEQVIPELVTYNNDGQIQGLDYPTVTSVLVKAIQEMNLNLESVASTTATTTPQSQAFATSFWNNTFGRLISWFADTANGIQKFFAKEVNTEKLCVSDGTGETCLTKAQLDTLIANASGAGGGGTPNPSPAPAPVPGTDTTAPVITINGNNPAVIDIGTSYVDLGASVTDTNENGVVNDNLGIYTNVDGVDAPFVIIDTSVAGVHTIIYSSTDAVGNVGTATRTVEVVDPNAPPTPPPAPAPAPTPEPVVDTTATTTDPTATTTPIIVATP